MNPLSREHLRDYVQTRHRACGSVVQQSRNLVILAPASSWRRTNTSIPVSMFRPSNSNGPINFTAQIVGRTELGRVSYWRRYHAHSDGYHLYGGARTQVHRRGFRLTSTPRCSPVCRQELTRRWIMFVASPETPVLPTSGSTALHFGSTVPVASGTTSPACIPISITITPNQCSQ